MTARTCDHPTAADQRYCLVCGAACAPPRVDWRAMLREDPAVETPRTGPPAAAPIGPRLPSPRTAAALVLGMLGFGVLIGGAAGPAVADGRALIIVQLPTPAAPKPAPVEPVTPDDSGPVDLADSTPVAETPASVAPAPKTTTTTKTTDDTPDQTATTPAVTDALLPPVKHVWILALRGTPFADPAAAPYLAGALRQQGALLSAFAAPAAEPLATGTALLSGTAGDKPSYAAKVPTIADRLTGAGQVWKAYADTPPLAPGESLCAPAAPLADRNPLLRFASISTAPECGSQVVPLEQLARDVLDTDSAPALSYLVPAAEHDGADVAGTDAWASTTIETIKTSKAYADGGLIMVLGGTAAPEATQAPGALLVSPLLKPGVTIGTPVDVYGLTRLVESVFALPGLDTPLTKDASPPDVHDFVTS